MDLYYFRYSNTFASLMLSEKTHYLLGHKIENMYLPLGLTKSVPTCGKSTIKTFPRKIYFALKIVFFFFFYIFLLY